MPPRHTSSEPLLYPVKRSRLHSTDFHKICASSVGIATRYGLEGPGIESRWGDEIFLTRPDRPWGPPSLLYNWYRVFPGGKAAGAWRWTPTPSSSEVEERVELYFYAPSVPSCPVLGWTLPLPLPYVIVWFYYIIRRHFNSPSYGTILTNACRKIFLSLFPHVAKYLPRPTFFNRMLSRRIKHTFKVHYTFPVNISNRVGVILILPICVLNNWQWSSEYTRSLLVSVAGTNNWLKFLFIWMYRCKCV